MNTTSLAWLTPSDYALVVVAYGFSFALACAGMAILIYSIRTKPE